MRATILTVVKNIHLNLHTEQIILKTQLNFNRQKKNETSLLGKFIERFCLPKTH